MKDEFLDLAKGLSEIMGYGQVKRIFPEAMADDERGWSGAELMRLKCVFADGRTDSFVCKYAERGERTVMRRLTSQRRGYTPLAYSDSYNTSEKAWFIMQDIRSCSPIPKNVSRWKEQVAEALADIHGDNMISPGDLPDLPLADSSYWEHIATEISIDHFERQCEQDIDFASEFAWMLPKLRRCAQRFARNMTELCREGVELTLTHGDLQDENGDHVRNFEGRPMIIDWGFARYAPIYIDLVDYFSIDETEPYLQRLRMRGFNIKDVDFKERYNMASLYPALIYMYPAIVHYMEGSQTRLRQILSFIDSSDR